MFRQAAAILAAALTGALFPRGAAADDFDALREDFLAAINAERARDGVVALRLSQPLSRLAQELAEELARRGERDFGEISEGEMVSRAQKAGYSVKSLTEIFTNVDGSIPEVMASWPRRDDRTWKSLVRGNSRDLGVGAAILDDVPLYVFLVGLSAEDFLAGRAAEYRDPAEMRRRMLDRVNAERRSRSLPTLAPSAALDRIAQAYADDMLKRSHYGHVDPEGLTVRERAFAGGYDLRFIAENLASGQSTVDEVMDGWMKSDKHRVNILSKIYTEAGFGLAIGRNRRGYQIIWVQVFGRPRLKLY
ncbi:MAG TPA: CAP domain-containing protein [Thermoanaerobaculia bacterium]|nr:CAP domain-containing protein [Thermoanaerobaculia bacterium]